MNQLPLPASQLNTDVSPEAVDQRLRELAQLYRLGMALQDAQLLGSAEEVRCRTENAEKGIPIVAGTNMKVVELVLEKMAYGWSPRNCIFSIPT